MTYETTRAEEISRKIQDIAASVDLETEGSRKLWRVKGTEGGLLATGIGGPLTGYGIDGVLVIDDPVKNRAEAESTAYRERAIQWARDVAFTRVHPGGSIVLVMTRWHPQDLAGTQIDEGGWEVINLPAVSDSGVPLWGERRPLKWLERKRREVGEYTWASLYQGVPRPRGNAVFRDVYFYDALPTEGYRTSVGLDLAYSSKTSADFSVHLVLWEFGGVYYVVEVGRDQVPAPIFGERLGLVRKANPYASFRWYCSGTEKGVADLLNSLQSATGNGLGIIAVPTSADKFIRAQPVAAAWNAGNVRLPRGNPPWMDAFVAEVTSFTGTNDAHDDQVDALAAAFDLLAESPPVEVASAGTRTWGGSKAGLDV